MQQLQTRLRGAEADLAAESARAEGLQIRAADLQAALETLTQARGPPPPTAVQCKEVTIESLPPHSPGGS